MPHSSVGILRVLVMYLPGSSTFCWRGEPYIRGNEVDPPVLSLYLHVKYLCSVCSISQKSCWLPLLQVSLPAHCLDSIDVPPPGAQDPRERRLRRGGQQDRGGAAAGPAWQGRSRGPRTAGRLPDMLCCSLASGASRPSRPAQTFHPQQFCCCWQ